MTIRERIQRNPETLLPLTQAELYILLSLTDHEQHGYSIMQEIAGWADNKTRIGSATLYRSIKRMLAEGLIEKSDRRPTTDDERRHYYRITNFGRLVTQAEIHRMIRLIKSAENKQLIYNEERL